jgi:hypothetical protein
MANNFDEFPLYDPLVKKGSIYMSDIWVDFMATFYQNLIAYITQNGFMLPHLTTVQRDAIIGPQNGQMIYNTTLGSAQYFKAGSWSSF